MTLNSIEKEINIDAKIDTIILLIDSSEAECGVALVRSGCVVAQQRERQLRKHGDLLLPLVQSVMNNAQVTPQMLTAIAVLHGPGAFTGIRIGVAMAQGLAYGWGIPCLPINTLDAWAISALHHYPYWEDVICMMDARMGEVYMARYKRGAPLESLNRVQPACCVKPETVHLQIAPTVVQPVEQHAGQAEQPEQVDKITVLGFVGSGAQVYQEQFINQASIADQTIELSHMGLCYMSIGVLAMRFLSENKTVDALELDALYLRAALVSS